MPPIRTAGTAFVLLLVALSLDAQTIRGTVVDSSSSGPVSAATIEILRPDSQRVARERTDDRGTFRARIREAGAYRIRVQRIGYRALDSLVEIAGDTALMLRLAASPVQLAPVGVTAELDSDLVRAGFYERKSGGVGHFLDPATIDRLAPKARVVADLLDHIPGVSVVTPSASQDGTGGVRVPHLRSCRTISRRLVPRQGPASASPGIDRFHDSLPNYPRVILDGMATGNNPQHSFGLLEPSQILAMEVYMGPSEVPLQYGGTDAPCGVILIWTKR